MSNKPSIPKGTRDFLPLQSLRRRFIFDTAQGIFQNYAYVPIETPAMENLDTLLGKYGEEGDNLVFKILESGDFLRNNSQKVGHIGDLVRQRFFLYDVLYEYLGRLIIEASDNNIQLIDEEFLQNTTKYIERHTSSWLFVDGYDYKVIVTGFLRNNSDRIFRSVQNFIEKSSFRIKDAEQREFHMGQFRNVDFSSEILPEFDKHIRSIENLPDILLELSNKISGHVSLKALRYDLTVPFARFVVQNQNELTFPFKRYQIQPVWRADRPQKGRYREFYQCDVDVIGSTSLLNEAELLCIVDDVFNTLGISDIVIRLNNRKILSGIAHAAGLSDHFQTMTVAIDKLDKIGLEGVKQELLRSGLPEPGVKKALNLINLKGEPYGTLKMLSGALTGVEEAYKGIEEMKSLLASLPEAVREKVQLDLTLARGLNYYTGAIIEVGHPDFPSSICGGGRYDDLTGIFGLTGMSGVGVSFGADRIYDLMEDKGLFPPGLRAGGQVLFINFGEAEAAACLKLAADLRSEGIASEVYPDAAKIKKQMKYANDKGLRMVVLIGEEEKQQRTARIKDMETGDEQVVGQKDLTASITQNLRP